MLNIKYDEEILKKLILTFCISNELTDEDLKILDYEFETDGIKIKYEMFCYDNWLVFNDFISTPKLLFLLLVNKNYEV